MPGLLMVGPQGAEGLGVGPGESVSINMNSSRNQDFWVSALNRYHVHLRAAGGGGGVGWEAVGVGGRI